MDEQPTLTDGAPPSTADVAPKLVTFALFAYNQEKYIREAVLGAFSQTYTPLEIILSDDGSTDRTYEIIQHMVAEYSGPHNVRCRQSPVNSGVYHHVASAIKEAQGELIVLAAGDDVSKAHRTRELVRVWNSTQAWGLWSKFDLIDADGRLLAREQSAVGSSEVLSWISPLGRSDFVHGATSAYDKRLFSMIPDPSGRIDAEDGVLNVTLALFDLKVAFCDRSLISYRQHAGASSNTGSYSGMSVQQVRANEIRLAKFAGSFVRIADFVSLISTTTELSKARYRRIERKISAARQFYQLRSELYSMSILKRVTTVCRNPSAQSIAFVVPRILGLAFFAFVKAATNTLSSWLKNRSFVRLRNVGDGKELG